MAVSYIDAAGLAGQPLRTQERRTGGLRLYRRRSGHTFNRRARLRAGILLRGLRASGHRQHGRTGGRQPHACDDRTRLAHDELSDRRTDMPQHIDHARGSARPAAWRRLAAALRNLRGADCLRRHSDVALAARRQSGRRGAQRHYGRLLPAAGQPHRGHVRHRHRRNHSMRRSRRYAVVDTDRQRQLDPYLDRLLRLPHRRHGRRSLGAGALLRNNISAVEHDGGAGAGRGTAALP